MLTEALTQYAHRQWDLVRPGLGSLGETWQRRVEELTGHRKTLLELSLGTLLGLDLAQASYETLLSYVDHGLFLRENSPFCKDIPEDIFLHYVFYPRINNEEIVNCRPFFYQQVWDRIEGLSPMAAAMAVNFWCACQMTYESTDDRTIDPLTAFRCGLGRCGEESTFAVAVLRAAGIPARQIYAPWWSQCDDNHAWVEVYVEGQWRFFGACEPEPVPDRGWFTSAASRAMAICSRRFFDYSTDGLAHEQLLNRRGCCLMENQTHRYAKTTSLAVHVPGEEAMVRIFVLNMASLREIAALPTDASGNVEFQLGLGSCMIEVRQGDRFCWEAVHLTGPTILTLIPQQTQPDEGIWDWDFIAPMAGAGNAPLTPEQSVRRAAELSQAAEARKIKASNPAVSGDPALDPLFAQAGENGLRLLDFLNTHGTLARELLLHLTPKDWRDASPAVLKDFLEHAPHLRQLRIGHELLRPWAGPIRDCIPQDLTKHPEALLQWLTDEFPAANCRTYPELFPDPISLLALGAGDHRDRIVLFTAALRLAGISAETDISPKIPLRLTGDNDLAYGSSWTLSRWEQDWTLLSLSGSEDFLSLPAGLYRLITVTRLPNGNQLARFHTFSLNNARPLSLSRRQGTRDQLLAHYPVLLPDGDGTLQLRLYLDVGTEPTEHALNELLSQSPGDFPASAIWLYIPEKAAAQDPTLRKVLKKHPQIRLCLADYQDPNLEYLARALYLEPGVWPLLLLTNGSTGYYSHCGYSVGSIPLALELLRDLTFD